MNDQKLTPQEELQAENEIKAVKLDLKYGGMTFISDDAPPELISEFLDAVDKREMEFQNSPKVPIYEYLGEPSHVSNPKSLTEEQAAIEVARFEKLFLEKNMIITVPDTLTARGYYCFIVEDLFPHLLHNYQGEGIVHTFDYSEFRQDGLEFMELTAQKMIESILDLRQPFTGEKLSEYCRNSHDEISKSAAIERVNAMRARYKKIIPIAFGKQDIEFTPKALFYIFGVRWTGVLPNGEKEEFDGIGICQMSLENREWLVAGVQMPGFEF